jgi:D-alanyl-D-alanine carboxypeptidase
VTVETAILALVTKSANDAAAALGELLGGSEQRFALMMTQKARGLGMSGTDFHNASGLPNPDQHTTARDMARLGMALRQHFPEYYSYFSTPYFQFGKQRMRNHNNLLGRVKGIDGIKTGYTNASGYNLVSSVTDGRKKIVAVVMGGATGRARDDRMVQLINEYLPQASGRGNEGAMIAYATATEPRLVPPTRIMLPVDDAPQPIARRDEAPVAEIAEAMPSPAPERFGRAAGKPSETAAPVKPATARQPVPPKVDPVETASVASSGWAIQVASAPSASGAKLIMSEIRQKSGGVLASAEPFTTAFKKGGATFYRVRFGGFSGKTAAWNACAALKKQRIECFAVQQ